MVNVINLLSAVSKPTGMWESILDWIEGGIVNYGWVIILFTLLVKVCLSPLDFLIRFSNKKSTLVQRKLAPQIARINKKYANDKNQAQLQTNALYKKEGFNVFGSCIIMLINLIVTMTVFLTLFNALRVESAYKAISQYDAMETAYTQSYNQQINQVKQNFIDDLTEYNKDSSNNAFSYETYRSAFEGETGIFNIYYSIKPVTNQNGETVELSETQQNILNITLTNGTNQKTISTLLQENGMLAHKAGKESANQNWKEVKDNWLWIDNIWVSDNYNSPVPTYDDLSKLAKNSKNKEYISYVKNIDSSLYTAITASVRTENNRWNGYFILAILAAATSFLSQYVSELMTKSKNKHVNDMMEQNNPAGGTMKFMKVLLPAMMVIFVVTSSSAFGIYIVWSSIISSGLSALIGLIVNACFKKKEEEVMASLEKEVIRSMKKLNKQKNK